MGAMAAAGVHMTVLPLELAATVLLQFAFICKGPVMTKRFAIIDGADCVCNVVLGDDPLDAGGLWVDLTGLDPEPSIGWSYVNGVFIAPPPPSPPIPEPNIITKIAMITRFTDSEFVGILTAAKTDPEVEGWYARFSAANTINLDDARTVSGVNMLVNKTLLTQARATAILTDPVQPAERP